MTIKKSKSSAVDDSGVFVYIGPSIKGIIQNGSIFKGSQNDILNKLAPAIEKYPKIKRLIVRDVDLAESREKINNGGNGLSAAYNALLNVE